MPRAFLLLAVLSSVACSPKSYVEGTLEGVQGGKPFKVTFDADSSLGLTATGDGISAGRDIAPLSALFVGEDLSVEKGDLKADSVSFLFSNLPTSPMRAGTFNAAGKFELTHELDTTYGVYFDANAPLKLIYEEVEWAGSGGKGTILRGTFESRVQSGADEMTLKGRFQVVADCESDPFFRICGNMVSTNDSATRPWVENDCPADIVASYDARLPTDVDGSEPSSLRMKDVEFECDGDNTPLCFSERTGVKADGCTWTVRAITDGSGQQLAISGWADQGCSRAATTCNTWR